jgi:hypothetical protein
MIASLAVGALIAVSGAIASVPAKYRYTGVVGPIAFPAARYFAEGGGLRFTFIDSAPPVRGLRYRVCVFKHASVVQCWNRRLRARNSKDGFSVGDFTRPRFGELVARWYVNGRVVATWRFYYDIGH